jgi:hypothetical protein
LIDAKSQIEKAIGTFNASIKKFHELSKEITKAWNSFMNNRNVYGIFSFIGVGYLFVNTGISWVVDGIKLLMKVSSEKAAKAIVKEGIKILPQLL